MDDDDEDNEEFPDDLDGEPAVKYVPLPYRVEVCGISDMGT